MGPKFSGNGREAITLSRHYSIQQVEYCRNLIYRRNFPIHKLFERSCDIGLLRMAPDKITQIFGFWIHKRLRGKLQSVLEKIEHGHYVFRACGKSAVLRMYEEFATFLRLGALSNNLKDFGLGKSLDNLDAVRKTLAAVTDRFAGFEAEALNVYVDFSLFQRLALLIPVSRVKVPGIKIQDTRYNIRKMKAHGLIERHGKRYAYRLTDKGNKVALSSYSSTSESAVRLPTALPTATTPSRRHTRHEDRSGIPKSRPLHAATLNDGR